MIRHIQRFCSTKRTATGPCGVSILQRDRSQRGQIATLSLLLVLLVVEVTDVIFAADSIPAVMAITLDPFIVYTSNVFAILGLRALYFALAGIMGMFHFLRYGLAAVLAFVGLKMLLSEVYKIPVGVALAIIAGILGLSVVISILSPKTEPLAERGR